ncbi:exocyst complex component, partial [Trifolium pratense]
GNPHFTSRFCKDELGPILNSKNSYCLIILRSSFSSLNVIPEPQCLGLEEQRVVIQVDLQQEDTDSGHVKGNYKLVVTDHNLITDALPHETINNLHETAKLMVDAGFEKVCFEVYNSYRKQWLEDLLGKTGFQDYVVGRWIKTSEVALKVLFPSERRLYNRIFSNSMSALSDLYFSELCHGAITELQNFADSFANRSPSAWRLFKILDLFATLSDLIPEFELLFLDSLVNGAIKIKNRLGEISRNNFMEFGNLIFLTPDAEFDCWADGGVHPMTCAATGYIVMASWSRQNLEQILQQYPLVDADKAETSLFYSQMVLIMEQFESKLDAKSQIYEDPAFRYFFMMNNLGHVTYRLETFWEYRFGKNVEHYFELYYRNSWDKVINVLKMDMNVSVAPNSETDSMKDKLKVFNQKFREMCGIQCF